MTEAPLDAEQIFRVLAAHEVDYLLIGGLAVQTHGHIRMTSDADLIPAPSRANLTRLAAALKELDAVALNAGHEGEPISAAMLPKATLWQFSTPVGAVDIAHEVPGGGDYDQLDQRALRIDLDGVEIKVVGLDDLIRMKLASGRPVDLDDIAALTDPLVGN